MILSCHLYSRHILRNLNLALFLALTSQECAGEGGSRQQKLSKKLAKYTKLTANNTTKDAAGFQFEISSPVSSTRNLKLKNFRFFLF